MKQDAQTQYLSPELAAFTVARTTAQAEYARHRRPTKLLRQLTASADAIVLNLVQKSALPRDLLLIATGGYGRQEIFPQSDLDLLFLCPGPAAEQAEQIGNLTAQLWDQGLRVSGSVRSLNDCLIDAKSDLTLHTAFLESRLLHGDAARYRCYQHALLGIKKPLVFFAEKMRERDQRHAYYQTLPKLLEPDCKNSPGGLRDLHLIFWIMRAAGWPTGWSGLLQKSLLSLTEVRQLRCCANLLTRLRIDLHYLRGRPGDQLSFASREQLAMAYRIASIQQRSAGNVLLDRYQLITGTVCQLTSQFFDRLGMRLREE